jgi:hypothetical protein
LIATFPLAVPTFAQQKSAQSSAPGSANSALGEMLCHCHNARRRQVRRCIAQGRRDGPPERPDGRGRQADGGIVAARIGGDSLMVCDGAITVQ